MTYTAPAQILPPPPIVSTLSRHSLGLDIATGLSNTAPASTAWNITKGVIYVPVYLDQSMTALKLWWANGATVGTNNVDCGIYSSSGFLPASRLINTGSTLSAGANVVQSVDITDTFLAGPGLYFLALTLDGVTATVMRISTGGAVNHKILGICVETTGAFGLPATATPVVTTVGFLPLFGFSTVVTI